MLAAGRPTVIGSGRQGGEARSPMTERCRHEPTPETCEHCVAESAVRRRGRSAPAEVFDARRLNADGVDLLRLAAAAPSDWPERLLWADLSRAAPRPARP